AGPDRERMGDGLPTSDGDRVHPHCKRAHLLPENTRPLHYEYFEMGIHREGRRKSFAGRRDDQPDAEKRYASPERSVQTEFARRWPNCTPGFPAPIDVRTTETFAHKKEDVRRPYCRRN